MADERRSELLDLIKREFIGPDPIDWPGHKQPNGEEILVSDPPRTRYIAGILYPQEMPEEETSGVGEDELDDEPAAETTEPDEHLEPKLKVTSDYLENAEELINRSNAYRQSAMSLTVGVFEDDSVRVSVLAGKYATLTSTDSRTEKIVSRYYRTQIDWNNEGKVLMLPKLGEGVKKVKVGDTMLYIDVTYRYRKGNCLIYTFTLENSIVRPAAFKDDDCYFQVSFTLESDKGFCPLPDMQKVNVHDEDYLSNQLLYRDVRNYAIGHGCAADWTDTEGVVKKIETSIFPMYEVKPIVPASIDGVTLEMLNYGPDTNFDENIRELNLLCDKYEEWIESRAKEAKKLDAIYSRADYMATAERHILNGSIIFFVGLPTTV